MKLVLIDLLAAYYILKMTSDTIAGTQLHSKSPKRVLIFPWSYYKQAHVEKYANLYRDIWGPDTDVQIIEHTPTEIFFAEFGFKKLLEANHNKIVNQSYDMIACFSYGLHAYFYLEQMGYKIPCKLLVVDSCPCAAGPQSRNLLAGLPTWHPYAYVVEGFRSSVRLATSGIFSRQQIDQDFHKFLLDLKEEIDLQAIIAEGDAFLDMEILDQLNPHVFKDARHVTILRDQPEKYKNLLTSIMTCEDYPQSS